MDEQLSIVGVKSKDGFYISQMRNNKFADGCERLLINGEHPKSTFNSRWGLISREPETVEKIVPQPRINHRFELIKDAPWVSGSDLPKSMPKHEVMEEADGYCEWKDEFKHLQSLYHEVSDPQPDKIEPVAFTYQTILEVDFISHTQGFQYPVGGKFSVSAKNIDQRMIDHIVFPDIVHPNLPCNLSSKDSYMIIREHVKRNIDSRYAEISSDYDFCFSVQKAIPLHTPLLKRQEIKTAAGRSYMKPRYKEWTVKNRTIKEVFEMTHAGDKYQGYTVIPGFRGDNHQDLKDRIDKYLDDLMARINEPLVDCPHCGGMGVVLG